MKNFTKSLDPESAERGFREAFELINPYLYTVDERVRSQGRAFEDAIEGYVTYACASAGKRLRPALALLSGGATGKVNGGHVDLAVIVELIHLATLVHDDIMDGAELRRDQPTANAKWGNAISVLLGDVLFAHALRLATAFADNEISRKIADASAEVCSGEIMQTQRRFDLKLAMADYFRMIEMKTAALFAVACELGAYLSHADPATIARMKRFGMTFGTAYQIYDDCLDLVGDEDEVGKTLGTDFEKGKFTLPILVMLNRSGGADRDRLSSMILHQGKKDHAELAQLLIGSGAVDTAIEKATGLIQNSQDELAQLPETEYREGLIGISEHLKNLIRGLGK